VVAMVHQDKRINELFNKKRESKGIKVIPLGRAARGCMQALNSEEMIALVGDREFGQGGVAIDFLGKKVILPEGPAFLSLKTDAIIIPAFIIREGRDKFFFIYEPFIEPVHTGDLKRDIVDLTSRYASVIERYIRKYPEQWLMFRQFWI
jgi:KDO2-lipid IV(A) lauroyltransferase